MSVATVDITRGMRCDVSGRSLNIVLDWRIVSIAGHKRSMSLKGLGTADVDVSMLLDW